MRACTLPRCAPLSRRAPPTSPPPLPHRPLPLPRSTTLYPPGRPLFPFSPLLRTRGLLLLSVFFSALPLAPPRASARDCRRLTTFPPEALAGHLAVGSPFNLRLPPSAADPGPRRFGRATTPASASPPAPRVTLPRGAAAARAPAGRSGGWRPSWRAPGWPTLWTRTLGAFTMPSTTP